MKIRRVLPGLLVILVMGSPLVAAEREVVGSLRTLHGPVFLLRGGAERALTGLERLHEGDVLRTGEGGSAGLLLKDNTSISMGPHSRLALEHFRFAPAQGSLGLVVRCFRGTMAFVSGLVAKLSPDSVKVETPVATVGVRGTTFLVKAEEK